MRKDYRAKRVNAAEYVARRPYRFFFSFRLILISFIALMILVILCYFREGDMFSFSLAVVVPAPDSVLVTKPVTKTVKPTLVFNFQNKVVQTVSDHVSYLLQLGSFSDIHQAQMLQEAVRHVGFSPMIRSIEAGNQTFYRVQLGSYKRQAEADEVRKRLEDGEISSVLISS